MNITDNIQSFLIKTLKEKKINRKLFSQLSNIPYPTVNKIFGNEQRIPDLKTILKIARYFNCSVDEVLGLDEVSKLENPSYSDIAIEDINYSLKQFLKNELKNAQYSQYNLGKKLGFNENIIVEFLKDSNTQKILSTAVLVALAKYFKVSIDKMIGRVSLQNQESQTLEKTE